MHTTPLPNVAPPQDTSRIFDTTIDPLVRLKTISAEEFENIVCEWAVSYLSTHESYKNVAQLGGSKDSGRDLVAYTDDTLQTFDIFQCKRYKDPLTPSQYMVEFGKLCYYTMMDKYKKPRKYFIVASNGIGQDLRELVENPSKINYALLNGWDKYCAPEKKITAEGVKLTPSLQKYIADFDFSIVSEISPPTLLEQFSKTIWYKYHFGGGLRKRPTVAKLPDNLSAEEAKMEYVLQLLKAYSNHESKDIFNVDDLQELPQLYRHFKRQREYFYNARALKRFSRDEFLNDDPYEDVKHQVYHGVISVCESTHIDDLTRVNETISRAQILPITTNEFGDISILEKSGMCHDLVNENEMRWVDDE